MRPFLPTGTCAGPITVASRPRWASSYGLTQTADLAIARVWGWGEEKIRAQMIPRRHRVYM